MSDAIERALERIEDSASRDDLAAEQLPSGELILYPGEYRRKIENGDGWMRVECHEWLAGIPVEVVE